MIADRMFRQIVLMGPKVLNPLEKWDAAQGGSRGGGSLIGREWLWVLAIIVGVVLLVTIIRGIIVSVRARRREQWGTFCKHANQFGLSAEERNLLYNVAAQAALKDRNSVFTSGADFDRGVAIVEANQDSDAVIDPAAPRACASCAFVQSLREKLHFDIPAVEDKPTSVKLGNVTLGKVVNILRQRSPETFDATIAGKTQEGELLVKPAVALEVHPGESWTVRYPESQVLWEFTAYVVSSAAGEVRLKPAGALRWMNRRQFARAATRRAAQVARFPFRRTDDAPMVPEFVPGEVIEIAAMGLMLKAPLTVETDERVLVVVELEPGNIIETAGVVRRVDEPDAEMSVFAVELSGLTTDEIADLARETNIAAHQMHRDGPETAPAPVRSEA